jgi:exocyst complex component 2
MTVAQELDKRLFDGYVKPKAVVVKEIIRNGILDSKMDWYETPQPTGNSPEICFLEVELIGGCRNTAVHVRNIDVPREHSRAS